MNIRLPFLDPYLQIFLTRHKSQIVIDLAASARAARRGGKTALPWRHGRHTAAAISRRTRAEQRWRAE